MEKEPPTYQEPSDALATSRTDAENGPAPISNIGSKTPLELKHVNRFTSIPL